MSHNIPYLPVPDMIFIDHIGRHVTRPITDHPPMIQNTAWGAIATMNILNPGSPYAPPFQIAEDPNQPLVKVQSLPADGAIQMKAMAEYIYGMFTNGVGMLALQEVPPPESPGFKILINNLRALDTTTRLIDVDALQSQWLKTGTHRFGTSILCNPRMFTLQTPAQHVLGMGNRVAQYQLLAASGDSIAIANIHGDFASPAPTKQFIGTFNGICLGDLNIPERNLGDVVIYVPTLLSIDTPTLKINSQDCKMNTADCILDNISRQKDPHFTPDRTRITSPIPTPSPAPVKVTPTEEFNPLVIPIAYTEGIPTTRRFKIFIGFSGPGRIPGFSLTTPSSTSSLITISDPALAEQFVAFQLQDKVPTPTPAPVHHASAVGVLPATISIEPPQEIAPLQTLRLSLSEARTLMIEFEDYSIQNKRDILYYDKFTCTGGINGVRERLSTENPDVQIIEIFEKATYDAFQEFQKFQVAEKARLAAQVIPSEPRPPQSVALELPVRVTPTEQPELQAESQRATADAATQKAAADAATQKAAEDAATQKAAEDAATQKAAEDAATRKAATDAATQKAAEDAATRKAAADAATRQAAADAATQKAAADAATRKAAADAATQKAAADAAIRKAAADAATRKAAADAANFEAEKAKLQQEFTDKLTALNTKIKSSNDKGSTTYKKGEELYTRLNQAQEVLFTSLTSKSSAKTINESIIKFRQTCEANISQADKVMGNGWLYKAVEIVIKSVIGLFAAIGMVVGVLAGQGLAKEAHRKGYADTFFTLNKTDSEKALNEFKTEVLGNDEEDQGLLDEKNMPSSKQ